MRSANSDVDVVIIGGGPAGLSAAAWCGELGLRAVLLDLQTEAGGQLHIIHNPIENYLGRTAADGRELLSHFLGSKQLGLVEMRFNAEAVKIDARSMTVFTGDTEIRGRALIIATGVRRRRLGISGELEFAGKGIIESGARDRESVAGKRVLIVGGGDAAFENALILAEHAREVKVAFRREEPTAREEFVRDAKRLANVNLLDRTVLRRIDGDATVRSVELSGPDGARTEPVDAVLIRIGVEPNSEPARDAVQLDAMGYIKVDQSGLTSAEGLFAIGDVAHPNSPTISTAVGTGATAAKGVLAFLLETNRI